MPTPSARRAAIVLAGGVPPPVPANLSAGESERLELVEVLASGMTHGDYGSRAVCRRLLQHLCSSAWLPGVTAAMTSLH